MDFDQELQQVAKTYEDEGYRVVIRPGRERLPPFASDFAPDLLASKGAENVLVRVKERRTDLASTPELSQQADATNAQPGWSFDLVILKQVSPVEKFVNQAVEPARQIELMLDKVEKSMQSGMPDVACVFAWAALEAAMRHLLRDRCRGRNTTPKNYCPRCPPMGSSLEPNTIAFGKHSGSERNWSTVSSLRASTRRLSER
jgi:hypothetical protein